MNLDEKKPALRRSAAATSERAAMAIATAHLGRGPRAGRATSAAGRRNTVAMSVLVVATIAIGRMAHHRPAMHVADAAGRRHTMRRATRVRADIVLHRPATATKRIVAIVRPVRRAISTVAAVVHLAVKRPAMAAVRPRHTLAEAWATVGLRRRDTHPTGATATVSTDEGLTMDIADRRRATTGATTITVAMVSMPALHITAADRAATRPAITVIGRKIMAIDGHRRRIRASDRTASTTAVRLLRLATATRIKAR